MRTEFDRQIETRNRAIEQVNTIFRYAVQDQITHGQILDKLQAVYSDVYNSRLTIAQKEFVRGYVTCKFDTIWQYHISWGFKPCGVFCPTFDEVLEKYHDEVVADRCNGFHYWTASKGERSF